MKDTDVITGLIELMLNYHKRGLAVLLGAVKPPRGRAVHEMINSLYTKELGYNRYGRNSGFGAKSSFADRVIADNERFNKVIELAGGWPHIVSVARESARADSLTWRLVNDYLNYAGTLQVRHNSRLGVLAAKYGLTVRELVKCRYNFARDLAAAILAE